MSSRNCSIVIQLFKAGIKQSKSDERSDLQNATDWSKKCECAWTDAKKDNDFIYLLKHVHIFWTNLLHCRDLIFHLICFVRFQPWKAGWHTAIWKKKEMIILGQFWHNFSYFWNKFQLLYNYHVSLKSNQYKELAPNALRFTY